MFDKMNNHFIIDYIKNIFIGMKITSNSYFMLNRILNNVTTSKENAVTQEEIPLIVIQNVMLNEMERDIRDLNAEFLTKFIRTLSMDDERGYTAIPSLTFLICSLIVVYFLTHRRSFFIHGHTWKQIAFRELIFQWGYYYVTRLWICFIKVLKWMDTACQHLIAELISHEIDWIVHFIFLIIYACASLLPLLIVINEKFNRPVMPNFMVWVGAHRWERTEMGMSGYYLDNPLRSVPMRTTCTAYRAILPAYRTRRSCSADHAIFLQQIQTFQRHQPSFPVNFGEQLNEDANTWRRGGFYNVTRIYDLPRLRYVRSMEHVTPISNINDIIR